MFVLRQLEFGLFDFTLHHTFEVGKADQVLDTLKAVKDKVAVIKGVEWARTPHSSVVLPIQSHKSRDNIG